MFLKHIYIKGGKYFTERNTVKKKNVRIGLPIGVDLAYKIQAIILHFYNNTLSHNNKIIDYIHKLIVLIESHYKNSNNFVNGFVTSFTNLLNNNRHFYHIFEQGNQAIHINKSMSVLQNTKRTTPRHPNVMAGGIGKASSRSKTKVKTAVKRGVRRSSRLR